MAMQKVTVCIVGAGVTGCFAAVNLTKLGLHVVVFEAVEREIFLEEVRARKDVHSVILLSARGRKALEDADVPQYELSTAVCLSKQIIHGSRGTFRRSFPGQVQAVLRSVSKQDVHMDLLKHLEAMNVEVVWGHSLIRVSLAGVCQFKVGRTEIDRKFDLVIGADGLHSAVRNSVLAQGRVDCIQHYLPHVSLVLPIPSLIKRVCAPGDAAHAGAAKVSFRADFALAHPDGVHSWNRGGVTLTAVPNADKSFTAVLTAPFAGTCGVSDIDPDYDAQVYAYFAQRFPDVVPITPIICNDFRSSLITPLVSVRTSPCGIDRVVLLGTAANADFSLFGFPSDAGLQDAVALTEAIQQHLALEKGSDGAPLSPTARARTLAAAVKVYSERREAEADARHELCTRHYGELVPIVHSSVVEALRRTFRTMLSRYVPHIFPSTAALLLGELSHEEALARLHRQDRWIDGGLLCAGAAAVGVTVMGVRWLTARGDRS